MDIVDINKVLDDLELNEEQQHSKLNGPQEDDNIHDNVYASMGSSVNQHSTVQSPVPPSSSSSSSSSHLNRAVKKKFVNVSNVFSSLNEYVNAGIETVKVTSDKTNSTSLPSETTYSTPTITAPPTSTETTTSNIQSPNTVNIDQSIIINKVEVPNTVANQSSTESIDFYETNDTTSSICNDLSEENEEISTLHSSMTRTSEYSAINEQETCSISNKLYAKKWPTQKQPTEPIDPAEKTDASTALIQSGAADRFIPQLTVTEIESAQNNDNERAEEAQLEQMKEMEIEQRQRIESIDRPESSNQLTFNAANDNMNHESGIASKSSDRFIKPISFESAATMDDVSDTELESYLQELEDLEESAHCDSNNHKPNEHKLQVVDAIQVQIENQISNDAHNKMIETSMNENTSDLNRNTSMPKDDTITNVLNGSYSNISTTTVTTIETTTDANVGDSSTFHQNPPNTFDTKNPDPVKTNELLKKESVPNTVEGDLMKNNEYSPTESDEQLRLNCIEADTNQMSNQSAFTPKRPNTLDITSVINLSNVDDTTVMPATTATTTGQLMTSSMSSSNSDVSSQITPINDSSMNPAQDSSNESPSNDATNMQTTPERSAAAAHLIHSTNISVNNIGKVQPYWIPDSMTMFCMQCNQKFSFIKRRHHCRACGLVLCSACCSLKSKLEYLVDAEARICIQCDILLNDNRDSKRATADLVGEHSEATAGDDAAAAAAASSINSECNGDTSSPVRSPNPNNPMEYCSVIPPYQQVASSTTSTPISVMVPVGVLKREGASSKSQRKEKNVMFSDGIRPGCDLTDLDNNWEVRSNTGNGEPSVRSDHKSIKSKANDMKLPMIDPKTNSYIPATPVGRSKDNANDTILPPICISTRTEFKYADVINNDQLIERLKSQQLKFMIQRNFYVLVKIIRLTCCINKMVINFTTQGLHLVGQDEIVILLEMDSTNQLPNDIFLHLNDIYRDADKGQAITELGFSMANSTPFLDSKEHGGFLFIRATFQCMQNVIIPQNPYLIGILIHRWEVPWAKIFPLRLMLRLGALHRYYPSPHVSVRYRNSVYAEIAQTIINFLADFRTYSYTLPTIRGMYIHMEDRRTNVLIPRNRYDQVMKALNNSSDHIIALAGNFSKLADGHLVCVQNTDSGCAETHAYSTQAINIQGKPRKVTGASFFVLNGALKTTSGLSGKCSIVEDGLMVQILPKKMVAIQQALKTMKDIDIVCGPVEGDESQTEIVCIQWTENDVDFNIGVASPIDKKPMDGVPSIRVHHGLDFANANHTIRWTEVFILKSDDESAHGKDPIDISKLSEQIARSASIALVAFLDLLASSGLRKLAIRATLDQDQVCYEAGANNDKFPPLYMNALDNELIPTLHRQATNLQLDQTICLELIFHILDV